MLPIQARERPAYQNWKGFVFITPPVQERIYLNPSKEFQGGYPCRIYALRHHTYRIMCSCFIHFSTVRIILARASTTFVHKIRWRMPVPCTVHQGGALQPRGPWADTDTVMIWQTL